MTERFIFDILWIIKRRNCHARFFDFERILNHQDPINDHKFRNIFNQYNKILTFQDKLCLAWTETYKCYPQKSKTIFNLNDKSFKNQFLTELLLQLFNTLSLYDPEHIFGVDNFLESTQFLNSNKLLKHKKWFKFIPIFFLIYLFFQDKFFYFCQKTGNKL